MIYLIILVCVFLLDFAVKRKIEQEKTLGQEEKIAGGAILVRKLHNYGVAGGKLKNQGIWIRRISGLLMCLMGGHLISLIIRKGSSGMKLAYSLILGGGLSNFVDRCTKGYVTDYFSFNVPWKKLKRLEFNLSDLFIILGSVILCICEFRKQK